MGKKPHCLLRCNHVNCMTVLVAFIMAMLSLTTTTAVATVNGISVAERCPAECHCLQQKEGSGRLKVTCDWPAIAHAKAFAAFPADAIHSLSVNCRRDITSTFAPGMFAKFVHLQHLAIRQCRSGDGSLPPGFARGLHQLKTLEIEDIWPPPPLSLQLLPASRPSSFRVGPDAFQSMDNLENLRLVNSQLAAVAEGMFCSLNELKSLNLSGNALNHFGRMGFDGCATNQLMILDVSNNHIANVSAEAFHNLINLHVLNMQANGLEKIDDQAFLRLDKLQELRLAGNRIVRLPKLPRKLQLLDVSNNHLQDTAGCSTNSNMNSDAVGGGGHFENLQQLNLSRNHITSLNHSCFDSAEHLKSVDFSFNRLSSLASGLPGSLHSIEDVHLSNNRIERFAFGGTAIDTYKKLVYLDLAHNEIGQVEKVTGSLPQLRTLILRNNRISSVNDNAFSGMPRLQQLDMASNLLHELPVALTTLSNLSSLDMSRNRLDQIQKSVFDKMHNLRVLTLAGNDIATVERHAFFNCSSLERLDLSRNAIKELSINCFDGAINLRHLHLQNNALPDIPSVLVNLLRLETLNVTGNEIRSVDFGLLPPALRELYAGHNRIDVITNFLQSMRPSGVKHADFSFNNLRHFQAHFLPPSIVRLNLSHNVIEEITGHFYSQDKALKTVDLSFNKIREANYSIFEIYGTPVVQPTVYLRGNPLSCSCRSQWLSDDSEQALTGSFPTIGDHDAVSCIESYMNKVHFLQHLSSSHFLCSYKSLCTDECVCCDFESCDCKSTCPVGCACLHDFAHKINIVECRQRRSNTVSPRSIPMRATEIFLDGTYFFSLERHAFFGRYRLRQLYLNNSEIYNISPKAFSGLTFLNTLDMSNNFITQLEGDEFFNMPSLSHFYLHNNRISSFSADAFAHMPSLRVLTLHGNQLRFLPSAVASLPAPAVTISLSNNPWKCDCGNRFLLQTWLPANKAMVVDSNAVHCQEDLSEDDSGDSSNETTILKILPPTEGVTVVKVNFWTFSNDISKTFCRQTNAPLDTRPSETTAAVDGGGLNSTVVAIVIIAVIVVLLTVVLFLLRYGRTLRDKLFYRKYMTHLSLDSSQYSKFLPDPLVHYDAFVSYSIDDEKFVREQLVSRLEQEAPYFRVCMLYRDLSADSFANRYCMAEDLMAAMEKSQRVITVLTDNFLKREWEQLQIRTSYKYLLRNRQRKLILVVLDDIPSDTEPILAHYLRTNRCIRWNDPMFWDDLMAAMPQQKLDVQHAGSSHYSDIYGTVVPSDFV